MTQDQSELYIDIYEEYLIKMQIPYGIDELKSKLSSILAGNDKCTVITSSLSSVKMYLLCAIASQDKNEEKRLLKAAIDSYDVIINSLAYVKYYNKIDVDEYIVKICINKMCLSQ